MKKFFIILLMQLIASSIYADVDRTRIYYFDTSDHNEENWIYYNDQLIFDEAYLSETGTTRLTDSLEIGQTYLFKVTYSQGIFETVDSCFTTYTCNMHLTDPEEIYLRDLYGEYDYGTFVMDGMFCGFHNIYEDIPYDEEEFEFGDYTEEEIHGMTALRGTYFFMDCTTITHVRIEIFKYY